MNRNKNWQPNLALLLAVGGVVMLVVSFVWDRQPPSETIPYNQLAERAADGEITAITVIDDRVVRAVAVDGMRYTAYAENRTDVFAEFEARGIDLSTINYAERDGFGAASAVLQVLLALGPVLVAVILFAVAAALMLRWSQSSD